ncbi:MAG TPA: hypothetical protein VLO07_08495 [Thermoanaerobaculia bacterium]|nr:hypothetical protein [Thermoanaerobaculia bacterium]
MTAAERAHFESHRAHCAECRHAAADFEAALSLYRSSGFAPAAPDLSARILRKLQASSPRRRPFGVFFGIDLKWAGAFAAALIAVIIGFSVVLRREVPLAGAPRDTAIRVVLEEKKAPENPLRQGTPAAARADSFRASAPAAAKKEPAGASAEPPTLARDVRPAAPSSNAVKEKHLQASRAAARPEAPSSAEVPVLKAAVVALPGGGRAGGEGAVAGSTVPRETPPPRLVILPADTEGSVPELLPVASLEPLAPERGREFLLIVGTQGRVLDVRTADSRRLLHTRGKTYIPTPPSPALQTLLDLRFAPADRPRRLLVRVE